MIEEKEIEENSGIWTVYFPDGKKINFHQLNREDSSHTVVIVNVKKMMSFFNNLPVEQGGLPYHMFNENFYQKFLEELSEKKSITMPKVSFYTLRKKTYQTIMFGFFKKLQIEHIEVINFTNGRNRSRLLEYYGIRHMPVEVHVSNSQLIREKCQ